MICGESLDVEVCFFVREEMSFSGLEGLVSQINKWMYSKKNPFPWIIPFLTIKNVVTLPHVGSATLETRYKMDDLAGKNLIAAVNQSAANG